MKPPPSFQFYPDDFIAGTINMSDDEKGLYITLLSAQWNLGSLPDDDVELALYSRGNPNLSKALTRVRQKFQVCDDGRLRNRRLEEVRRKTEEFKEACAKAGKSGGGNPAFKTGKPNPYYSQKDKGRHKGKDKGHDKGKDKGLFISPLSKSGEKDKGRHKGKINSLSPSPSPSPSDKEDDKALSARARNGYGNKALSDCQTEIAEWLEFMLGDQWRNDAGKWVNRLKVHEDVTLSVAAEVQNAIREGRVKTTPAQYAEQIWKEFSGGQRQ